MKRTFKELSKLNTFEERFDYLKLDAAVSDPTFGPDRVYNQMFYTSREWRDIRNYVIARDNGLDLGILPTGPHERLTVHHLNPISMDDISNHAEVLLDPDNMITVTHATHNALHFGDDRILTSRRSYEERSPGDTCLWKKGGR